MNVYQILRVFTKIKSRRLKLLGILGAYKFSRPYIGVFLDPIVTCNLRCRKCYMSDPSKSSSPLKETLDYLSKTFFPHALKLQIGCATEPTLYPYLSSIIQKGKEYGMPYISMTSNGQLLSYKKLENLIEAGLDELTLSIHGFDKDIYENMMPGASFEKIKDLIADLKLIKERFPKFSIRINYVMNADNIRSLKDIFLVLKGPKIDVLQLPPVQNMGDSSYNNFSMSEIINSYDDILKPIQDKSCQDVILYLSPTLDNLKTLEKENENVDTFINLIEDLTYYYKTQKGCNKENFDWGNDTFSSYHKCNKTSLKIFRYILWKQFKAKEKTSTKKLNFTVK